MDLLTAGFFLFPKDAGLTVIYGPNEAGKSTSLAAITDFLYGIPDRTRRGQHFGYDQIRLTGTVLLGGAERFTLRRRKGRAGRTLTDENGHTTEEVTLSRHLGAVDRDRFESLFGLDHNTLRTGGIRLLEADGDIGRLIVEAGGGLRALVDAINRMNKEADSLFATTRAAHRAFYKALDSYKAADDRAKEGLLTREAYDNGRKRLSNSQEKVSAAKEAKKKAGEQLSKLERLARVIPTIRQLDQVEAQLTVFQDLPGVRDGFADVAKNALASSLSDKKAFGEAEQKCSQLAVKIEALSPNDAVLAAEPSIRDIKEMAVHVRKARGDRPNRQTELEDLNKELDILRRAVSLNADCDLEKNAPALDAIELVQKLANQGLELRTRILGLEEQIDKEKQILSALAERQAKQQAAGRSEPLGITAVEIAPLPSLWGALETKRKQANIFRQQIADALTKSTFSSVDALTAWSCPDTATIQTEIERRTLLEAEFIKTIEKIANETTKLGTASETVEQLTQHKEVPTDDIISEARTDRDEVWHAIAERYLSPSGHAVETRPIDDRKSDIDEHRQRVKLADSLVDRKSLEAKRIAALELAHRQKYESAVALAALREQQDTLNKQLEGIRQSWQLTWPEATQRQPDLGHLKSMVEARATVLTMHASLQSFLNDIELQVADFEPRRSLLKKVEFKFKNTSDHSVALSERVSAALQAIKFHEDAYADYRQDAKAYTETDLRYQECVSLLNKTRTLELEWRAAWTPAALALSLDPGVEPERANEIATCWAKALGDIQAMKLTRARLNGMEKDQQDLQGRIASVAQTLDFELPSDCLAAASMLAERLEQAQKLDQTRRTLSGEFEEAKSEANSKKKVFESSLKELDDVCAVAGCARHDLDALVGRILERDLAVGQIKGLAETILRAGDGLPLSDLRAQWAQRDLDLIKAELAESKDEGSRLELELETAIGELQDSTREMLRFSAAGSINEAVAAREGAIAEMQDIIERYIEITMAKDLLSQAMEEMRTERQDPLIARAGALFSLSTKGAFLGIEADVDENGLPVVVGRRASGGATSVKDMSDGVRDQLFLAFRIASIENYCVSAEPLPFVADDLLIHFDDTRSAAALTLLAELGKTTQVLLFTHHRHVQEAAQSLAQMGLAAILELETA